MLGGENGIFLMDATAVGAFMTSKMLTRTHTHTHSRRERERAASLAQTFYGIEQHFTPYFSRIAKSSLRLIITS